MNPRYFIGVALPKQLTEKITAIQHEAVSNYNVMEPLVPHITLLHPNILMTLAPIYFVPKVTEIAKDLLPIDVELTDTAMFDKRVLHIAVKSPGLIKLQKKLVELLPDDIRARYEVGRSFTPHVTLAQAKPLQELPDDLINAVKHQIDALLPTTFNATILTQFTWQRPRTYKIQTIS